MSLFFLQKVTYFFSKMPYSAWKLITCLEIGTGITIPIYLTNISTWTTAYNLHTQILLSYICFFVTSIKRGRGGEREKFHLRGLQHINIDSMIYIHQLPTQYLSFFQVLNELYFIMLLKRPISFIIEDKTSNSDISIKLTTRHAPSGGKDLSKFFRHYFSYSLL